VSREVPPPFPRIPVLLPGGGAEDDRVATASELRRLLTEPVVVEEKLDGMSLTVWLDDTAWPRVASRSGKTQGDRGGQLGRATAWASEHAPAVRALLAPAEVLYAEWMGRTHSVAYDALPDWLVVLDLWTDARGFASAAERDRRCDAAGLAPPPVLYRGQLGDLDVLRALHGCSRYGSDGAEGLVVRLEREGRLELRAKWLAPGFERKSDEAWRRDHRMNRLRLYKPPLAAPTR
jgi:hypothetical protein